MNTTRAHDARADIEQRLEQLFDRISRLSDAELVMLRAIWDEEDETQRAAAWQHVRHVTRDRSRAKLLDQARSRLSAWVNNYLTATAIEYGNFLINSGSAMDAASVRRAALPPLLDATAAIVATDALDSAEQALLLEPLAHMSGPHGD